MVERVKKQMHKPWVIKLLIVVSCVLSAVEVGLPFLEHAIPRGVFAFLSAAVGGTAWYARIKAQQEVIEDGREAD